MAHTTLAVAVVLFACLFHYAAALSTSEVGRLASSSTANRSRGARPASQQSHSHIIVFKNVTVFEFVSENICIGKESSRPACSQLGVCRHLFRASIFGVSGPFTPLQVAQWRECLKDGIDYIEEDGQVLKAERAGEHREWWKAVPPVPEGEAHLAGRRTVSFSTYFITMFQR